MISVVAFLVGWCGNEPRRLRLTARPPRPRPEPPWPWLVTSVLAGVAGIGGSLAVMTVIGGGSTEPVTVLASMAGAFAAGRAFSGAANAFLGARDAELSPTELTLK